MKFYKPFGGNISKEDRKDYSNRASNYYDGKFHNEDDISDYKNNWWKNIK